MHLFQMILGTAVTPDVRALDFGVAQLEPEPPQLGRVLVRQPAVPTVLALPDHVREVIFRGHRLIVASLTGRIYTADRLLGPWFCPP